MSPKTNDEHQSSNSQENSSDNLICVFGEHVSANTRCRRTILLTRNEIPCYQLTAVQYGIFHLGSFPESQRSQRVPVPDPRQPERRLETYAPFAAIFRSR